MKQYFLGILVIIILSVWVHLSSPEEVTKGITNFFTPKAERRVNYLQKIGQNLQDTVNKIMASSNHKVDLKGSLLDRQSC